MENIDSSRLEQLAKENSLYELQIHILNDENIEQKKKEDFLFYISKYMKDEK